jgi:hypothetical protein
MSASNQLVTNHDPAAAGLSRSTTPVISTEHFTELIVNKEQKKTKKAAGAVGDKRLVRVKKTTSARLDKQIVNKTSKDTLKRAYKKRKRVNKKRALTWGAPGTRCSNIIYQRCGENCSVARYTSGFESVIDTTIEGPQVTEVTMGGPSMGKLLMGGTATGGVNMGQTTVVVGAMPTAMCGAATAKSEAMMGRVVLGDARMRGSSMSVSISSLSYNTQLLFSIPGYMVPILWDPPCMYTHLPLILCECPYSSH